MVIDVKYMTNLNVFYRLSDKGNPKQKLDNAGKMACLENAVSEFGKLSMFVILDNCNNDTVNLIKKKGLKYIQTSLGNSGSFKFMVNHIKDNLDVDDYVYLLEDDYLHLAGSKNILLEGLKIADYVSLYDHPDKYILRVNGGNPLNVDDLQQTRVFLTKSTHWREINSTTMTFACRVGTLIEDLKIWEKYSNGTGNPNDFFIFLTLTQNGFGDALKMLLLGDNKIARIIASNLIFRKKKRKLISPIPSKATHAELKWLAPLVDWNAEVNKIL